MGEGKIKDSDPIKRILKKPATNPTPKKSIAQHRKELQQIKLINKLTKLRYSNNPEERTQYNKLIKKYNLNWEPLKKGLP